MVGSRRSREVRLMAAIASRRQSGVVVIDVALRAGDADMGASQRERGVVVIEGGLRPRRGVMACVAGCGKAGADVVWIGCSGVICLMTAIAGCGKSGVVVVHMTLRAWDS